MGAKALAIADIARALEIDPDNIIANRRMLAWATEPQQKTQPRRALLKNDTKLEFVRMAIHALRENGQRNFARVNVLADEINGWAVWEGDAPLTISIASGSADVSIVVEPDAFHPLAEFARAADFSVKRPLSTTPQFIVLSVGGKSFYSTRTAGNEIKPRPKVARSPT